ncbi:hypothetical protein ACFE04_025127 [Oxalis oulophora]
MEDQMITIKTKKHYNNRKQLIYKLTLNSLALVICSLISSNPFYFLLSSIKHFFISLPYIWTALLFSPKCLFIVVNVIVAFLVLESKLFGAKSTRSSSPANEIYDEYIEKRKQQLREIRQVPPTSDIVLVEVEQQKESVYETSCLEEQENVTENEKVVEQVGKEKGKDQLPTEELNRRIEDFISRVNRQRLLESRSLACSMRK